jgi:hypothetical protein
MTTAAPLPRIDYLTKDFNSFRRLMLDRLAVLVPAWSERHAPDTGMVLLDILAYAADYLSYDQDAVATEAYLGTARRRISARRHARLLDYFMHDGCNARVFVVLQASTEGNVLPASTPLLTRAAQQPTVMSPDAVQPAIAAGSQVFETMQTLTLHASQNTIALTLPLGTTSATLQDTTPSLSSTLGPGDLLLFEEVAGPQSGLAQDADPDHRQVVRLTSVTANPGNTTVSVAWAPGDALTFTLVPLACVARGNVLLADHGQTLSAPETLPPVGAGMPYRPVLARSPVTQQGNLVSAQNAFVLFDPQAPAAAALADPLAPPGAGLAFASSNVRPAIQLTQSAVTGSAPIPWSAQQDLLSSVPFATDFVVEVDDAGSAHLRFGDDVAGKAADPGSSFQALYRVGNGAAGNVGAESIVHVVTTLDPGILGARNPLPAAGGVDPETVAEVQMNAPQAFQIQQRAVTRGDHVTAALQCPGVMNAVAQLRWTGSYYVMLVTVQRTGGQPVDSAFQAQVLTFLEPFRLAGWDIEVAPPKCVPIQIALAVAIAPGYLTSVVFAALQTALGTGTTTTGQPAFFNPDNFTFGQTIYFSQIVNAAMAVPGVAWIDTGGSTVFSGGGASVTFNLPTAVIQLGATELPTATVTLSIAEST